MTQANKRYQHSRVLQFLIFNIFLLLFFSNYPNIYTNFFCDLNVNDSKTNKCSFISFILQNQKYYLFLFQTSLFKCIKNSVKLLPLNDVIMFYKFNMSFLSNMYQLYFNYNNFNIPLFAS